VIPGPLAQAVKAMSFWTISLLQSISQTTTRDPLAAIV